MGHEISEEEKITEKKNRENHGIPKQRISHLSNFCFAGFFVTCARAVHTLSLSHTHTHTHKHTHTLYMDGRAFVDGRAFLTY